MKMRGSSAKIGSYVAATLFIPGLLLFAFVHMEGHRTRQTAAGQRLVSASTPETHPELTRAEMAEAYGKLPLAFEKNMGQTNPQVQYLSHGQGYELFLTPQEAVLSLRHAKAIGVSPSNRIAYARAVREANRAAKTSVVRMQFAGANPAAEIMGLDKLARKTDYFTGNNPKDWRTDVPSYSRVEYRGIYPGVDAVFYGNQSRLEYDFVVAPGADPRAIALNVEGARKLRVDAHGNLVMNVAEGAIELEKPVVYQTVKGERRDVAGNYVVRGDDRVAFDVSRYDPSQPLLIDPVLDYSTYLGGSVKGDYATEIAVDANGDAFITGKTFNATFPAGTNGFNSNSPDPNVATNGAAFVSELDPTGTQELYFSYLSGNGGEFGFGIAVDPVANTTCENGGTPSFCVYVTGQTSSTNYPVNSVVTPYNAGPPSGAAPTGGNAFITKLNPYASGNSSLLYSSYLASVNAGDAGVSIAVDASQDAYITGSALAGPGAPPNFPILNGAQITLGSANGNAFLTVINTIAPTNALIYSSYLGGDDANIGTSTLGLGDYGFGVVVDSNKIAYIAGSTVSSNFPSYLSTATYPNIKGFTAAPAGNTQGAGFVSAINTAALGPGSLIYSTYLGGGGFDFATGIGIAGNGMVFVTGQTTSSNFFVTQSGTAAGQFPSPANSAGVSFVTQINTTITGDPPYSVLLGGSHGDIGNGIQADSQGNAIVVGLTQSVDFPVTPGAFKAALGSSSVAGDAFIAKIKPAGGGSSDLLYSTYFGGSGTPTLPDQAFGVAVDLSNNVYVSGQTYSTDLPVAPNPGAFQATMPGGDVSAAFVAKLTLQPTLAVSPLSVAFGNQVITQMSAAQIVTLTNNTGSAIGLTIPLPALTGTNPGDFAAAPAASGSIAACTTSLSAGNSCAIGVTFTPSLTAAESATLNISFTYNNGVVPAASGSEAVGLSGTGVVAAPGITVTPASPLTFSGQLVTTSSAQTVTVTNSGNSNLTFSAAPSISGTNSTDFAISSGTTCSTSTPVTAGNSCIIKITFAPPAGAAGARSAALTIADNASGSPQTEVLAGTAWDFSLSAQSATVGSNGTASVPVTVTGIGGFTGPVTLSCSASIPHGTCTAPATPVTAPGTANVTIATNAFVIPSMPGQTPPISPLQIVLCLLGVTLLFLFPVARRARTRLGLAGAAVLFVVLAGCANTPPTSAGQYTLTITGTSGSVSHQTTATVTVK